MIEFIARWAPGAPPPYPPADPDPFAAELRAVPWRRRFALLGQALRDRTWAERHVAQWVTAPLPADLGPLRFRLRAFSADEFAHIRANAPRHCGVPRVGDYVRACGLRALHECMPPTPPGTYYTTLNILDRRPRRQKAPILHNLVAGLPVGVPVEMVTNVRATTDVLRAQTAAHLAAGRLERDLAALWAMTRSPAAWLAAGVRARLRPGRSCGGRLRFAPAPSLPMGLYVPAAKPPDEICGVPVRNSYGFRRPAPDVGFALDANIHPPGFNIAGLTFENRLPPAKLDALLERFAAALLE